MFADELGAGVLVANGTALNEPGLAPVDVGPCNGSKRLHRQTLCHLTPAANLRSVGTLWPVRTRRIGKVPIRPSPRAAGWLQASCQHYLGARGAPPPASAAGTPPPRPASARFAHADD